ncbi:nucleotidyl transferase AbiEii/AbiGii toxin family protein [Lysinibacillus cavernae]|uniref:nucleotidyl transferase AbiEii/AbiGii toxin family protein n=1 Tax=Lysinibacillus cavernae TaxID=2666135 RepID=UPI0012D8A880|nr:nucleotidyl transferase AbiEii/AbiGii toxin family protein [Lysinibacillus cavernae]
MGIVNAQSTNVVTQLTEMAETRQESMDQLISLYCQERLLYRLSVSSYDDQFNLDGDLLLFALTEGLVKPSKEILLIAKPSVHQNEIVKQAFKEICSIAVPEDDIEWFEEEIESTLTDDGIHLTIPVALAQITSYIEVRINFKENVRVTPKTIVFPTLLDMKAAVLYTYPMEFIIAQKFIEMYQYPALEKTASAMAEVNKLLQTQNIDGRILQAYIVELFDRHHFTIELNPTLEISGVLKHFFSPVYEVILAENEFFKQWNVTNQAWQ